MERGSIFLATERDARNATTSTTSAHYAEGPYSSKKNKDYKREQKQPEKTRPKRHMKKPQKKFLPASSHGFFCRTVRHLKQVKKIKTDGNDKTVTVKIQDVYVKVEPDSGAEANVMDEH